MSRLDWPGGFERTASEARSPNRSYDVSLAKAFDDLERELVRLDVDDYRYSFDAEQRQRDGRPYSRAHAFGHVWREEDFEIERGWSA